MWQQRRLFPELGRFPKSHDARAALKRASSRLLWKFIIGSFILAGLFTIATFSLPSVGVPISARGGVHLVLAVLLWTGILAFGWSIRGPIRRNLRQQLVEEGIPICVSCGYDLSHLRSDRCPECGSPRAVRRTALRVHDRCPTCGYDLRGNPAQGCPECGWGREGSDEPGI